MRYIALLRGINVGGNHKVDMPALKAAFEEEGFTSVSTYINSGNILFDSAMDAAAVQTICESLMERRFQASVRVGIVRAEEWAEAIANAPQWWGSEPDATHNALFVIAPMTAAEAVALMGEAKPEYEKLAIHGNVIFWTASRKGYSRTRWSKIVFNKPVYQAITIRNANTARKLAELAGRTNE